MAEKNFLDTCPDSSRLQNMQKLLNHELKNITSLMSCVEWISSNTFKKTDNFISNPLAPGLDNTYDSITDSSVKNEIHLAFLGNMALN